MSDIDLRLDGLLLAAVIAVTATGFALVALVALILRRWRLLNGAAMFASISLGAFAATLAFAEYGPATTRDYDWLDWLIVPWLPLVGLAGVRLLRTARAEA